MQHTKVGQNSLARARFDKKEHDNTLYPALIKFDHSDAMGNVVFGLSIFPVIANEKTFPSS